MQKRLKYDKQARIIPMEVENLEKNTQNRRLIYQRVPIMVRNMSKILDLAIRTKNPDLENIQ